MLDHLSNGHASEVHDTYLHRHTSIDAITVRAPLIIPNDAISCLPCSLQSPPPASPEIHLMPTLTMLSDDVRKEREVREQCP